MTHEDGAPSEKNDRIIGGYHAGDTIESNLLLARKAMNEDRHLKTIERIQFIKGNIENEVPKFAADKRNGLNIALLNLDVDLYKPPKSLWKLLLH